jgi:hypothetical protein
LKRVVFPTLVLPTMAKVSMIHSLMLVESME